MVAAVSTRLLRSMDFAFFFARTDPISSWRRMRKRRRGRVRG
jgi:hypothetical protein